MIVRLARAYGIRPGDLQAWDYWTEYVPALEQICETPLVDEMIAAVFRGKASKSAGTRELSAPMKTKEERKAAFERLQREAERRKNATETE